MSRKFTTKVSESPTGLYRDKIRLTSTVAAALSSTGHAFQVGATSGANLIIDTDEIMRRSNGAAATLNLNKDGGAINMRINAHGYKFIDSEIQVLSTDTNRDLTLTAKGTGGIRINDKNGNRVLLTNDGVSNAANYIQLTNAITAGDPIIAVQGGGSNIGIIINPKGTGNFTINGNFSSTGIDDNATSIAMTINALEEVLIGKTSDSFATAGVQLSNGAGGNASIEVIRDGGPPILLKRLTDDGNLIELYQDATLQGAISVSGTEVSYGSFCGSHWSQLSDLSTPDIPKGTVVSTIDEMCEWYAEEWEEKDEEGNLEKHYENVPRSAIANPDAKGDRTERRKGTLLGEVNGRKQIREDNDQLVKFKISDVLGDTRIYGVMGNYDGGSDYNIHSVGATLALVSGPCKGGDLLQSAGDGTAKVQIDDIIRSRTLAKVNLGFPDATPNEVNLVPVSLCL